MKNSLIHILTATLFIALQSCVVEEQMNDEASPSTSSVIEFVARPTVYDQTNVSTKVSANEITELENHVYTAFFMLFDDEGNRVILKDLTADATAEGAMAYTIDDQVIKSDICLSNATACFITNVSTDYARSLTTVAHLKGKGGVTQNEGALSLNYSPITSECVGIPLLTDASKDLNDVYCIPMAGVYQGDLYEGDYSKPIKITLKRLLSKIIVKLSVNIPDDNPNDNNVPQFTLSNFVVNNMPTKVALMLPEAGVDSTAWAASTNPSDYLKENNWMSNFNLDNGADDSETVTTGQGAKSLFFYVPEHMVPRDYENDEFDREQYKPFLFSDPKKPLYVSIKGNLNVPGSSPMIADYNIYLGENSYDDFNIKRNIIYTNNVVINGADADHRVEFTHGDVSVLFKRATYLDSHFEVRPLRVKWSGRDEDDNLKTPEGTVTVKVLDAYDENAAIPTWVRLERPTAAERNNTSIYCGTIGKRKYFTTNLVQSDGTNAAILGNNTVLTYNINDDADGDYPTWVYVDEFISLNGNNTFSDAVRQAKIRVTYTPPEGSESKVLDIDYVITQRSIYPVTAVEQTGHTYGIEFFEEYLYDYDRVDIEDLGDGEYASTQDGMEWGLDGLQLSTTNPSISVDAEAVSAGIGGSSILGNLATLMINSISDEIGPVYDFYTSLDTQVAQNMRNNYSGLSFSNKIVTQAGIGSMSLIEEPSSAVEYCFNKNKRNSDGSITTVHWYLPAIDEVEDIVKAAYKDFDVFKNKFYWSSQPAFYPNHILYDGDLSSLHLYYRFEAGSYYEDDPSSARATQINDEGVPVSSGADGYKMRLHMKDVTLTYSSLIQIPNGIELIYTPPTMVPSGGYTYPEQTHTWPETVWEGLWPTLTTKTHTEPAVFVPPYTKEGHEGNFARTGKKNRVRCVYDPQGQNL